jgi:glutamate N-acetyltransferase/amino-acid N-acetyltransferase
MAVGELHFPVMPAIKGLRLNAVSAGIKKGSEKKPPKLDVVLIALPETATVAGVFTQNAFCAAPVTVCKKHLQHTSNTRYLLINSGNANACTGEQGMTAALATCAALADYNQVSAQQVLPFSTGVIGEPLPFNKIVNAVPALVADLHEDRWDLVARGIMTTDTRPKGASISLTINGETIIVNGVAKGAGMIKPNMATMLGYVATNAAVSEPVLKKLLKHAADCSFNRITIDGDTSTNDSCILMAAGTAALLIDDETSQAYSLLKEAIVTVFQTLAQAIVRDGEGATKFVTILVEEGNNSAECLQVAYAIAHSPLIKTALFASDPNWGRIVAAIGYAGVDKLQVEKIRVYLGDVLIVENGGRAASYTEDAGQTIMNQTEIELKVCLGRGAASETIWTTDLSHEYVTINAEYRT